MESTIVALVIGLLFGLALGFLLAKTKLGQELAADTAQLNNLQGRLEAQDEAKNDLTAKFEALRLENIDLNKKVTEANTSLTAQAEKFSELSKEKEKSLQDQRDQLQQAETKLKEAFASLSSEALTKAQNTFLEQADSKFRDNQVLAKKDWESIVKPVSENLEKLEKLNTALGEKVSEEYGSLDKGIQALSSQAAKLSNALSKPIVRGNWGEKVLAQMLEDAGLIKGENFFVQESSRNDEGDQLRPDIMVKLPPDRRVIIDSKTPFEAFNEGVNAADDDARREAYKRHASLVKSHVNQLSSKGYWKQYEDSFDFVILFMPTEAMYLAAIQADDSLIQFAKNKNVFLINPSTMLAMINLMGQFVREERMAETALQVQNEARVLGERIATFLEHVARIGNGINTAAVSFNSAISSYDSRVKPQMAKVEKLGIKLEAKELSPIPTTARDIPELTHAGIEANSSGLGASQLPEPPSPKPN